MKQKNCLGSNPESNPLNVSCLELFEFKNEEYFAIGLFDGRVLIKQSDQVLSKFSFATINPHEFKDEEAQ